MLEREMNDLTNEQLCDIMCSNVEYDDNIFYVYNVDKYKNLWEYKGIEKEDVYIVTYDREVFKLEEVETYDWFDWSEVQEQFYLMEINTLEELLDMMNNFEESIIIEKPWEFDVYNNLKRIKIYDGWE